MTGAPLSLLRSSAASFANTNRTAGTMRSSAASLVKTASGFEAYSAGNVGDSRDSTPSAVRITGIAFGWIGRRLFTECAVDRRTPNTKRLGDGGRAEALLLERPHPHNIYCWFAALVDAGCLCL